MIKHQCTIFKVQYSPSMTTSPWRRPHPRTATDASVPRRSAGSPPQHQRQRDAWSRKHARAWSFQLCRPNEKEAVKDEESLERTNRGTVDRAKKPRMAHSWLISAVGTEYVPSFITSGSSCYGSRFSILLSRWCHFCQHVTFREYLSGIMRNGSTVAAP